jgi:SAM-dependent methyltransferase
VSVAATLAGAFDAAVRHEGLEPDPHLRLLALAGVRPGGASTPDPAPVREPHDLGPLHERLVGGDDRRRRGAWYTTRWLAEDLVARALPDPAARAVPGTVVDPACGGGVFLLAAADHLAAGGLAPADALARLWGCDLDPLAVAVSEAALWWWAARAGAPTRPANLVVGDALAGVELPRAGAVVGNPPFLGQLRTGTAATDERRAELRERFGAVVRPYTDAAWIFLLAAARCLEPGGRAALVQPQSVLGARDAAAVRDAVGELADVVDLWVEAEPAFDGAVPVCAPVLQRRAPTVRSGPAAPPPWTAPLADARGVPGVELAGERLLGDVAGVHAGFRDEFYGLAAAVTEGGPGLRLVTAGTIDPCRHLADRAVRFAGRSWRDPRADPAGLDGRARRWAELQAGPKVLVATQTRVLEAVADPDGVLLASVPVLCVRPHEPESLWHLVAALHAPAATAWLLRRTIGTARSGDACKPTVAVLGALPLPAPGPAWDRAAELAQRCTEGAGSLTELGEAADAAYGVDDPSLFAWWVARLPRR